MSLLLPLGLVLFVLLVVVHEFGHFIMARRNGVEVEEFGIGFPPKAKVLGKRNGTVYTLNWLPLGGFVKLKGEHDNATENGSFGAASLLTKVKIMLAGVVMNLLVAFLILTFLALVGMPKLIDGQYSFGKDTKTVKQEVLVGYVEPNSPASRAGIKSGDRLLKVGDYQNTEAHDLHNLTQKYAGQTTGIIVQRAGQVKQVQVSLRTEQEVRASLSANDPKGYLGISPTDYTLERSTWSAPIVALGIMKQFTLLTYQGLGSAVANLFRGNTAAASSGVSGPVGIFVLLKDGSLLGYQFVLMIIAVISLTLALINVLPFPALDGGRLFVTLLFRMLKKPLTKKREETIHGSGFVFLMILFVLVTIIDVKRFF